jgi:RNA polymerase sigma-70 factor (ECF subfamily)
VKSNREYTRAEEPLIAKARAGSSEAFSELVWKHSQQIYGVSLRILKNHSDAEDNLQDVFCKVHKNIQRFEGRSRFSTWLVRIAINEASMKIRRQHSECVVFHADMPRPEGEHGPVLEIEDDSPNPERQCITNELAAKVFTGLHPSVANTFIRHKVEGWTQRELAKEMGLTVATIKSRIFRARAHMQQQLQATRRATAIAM